MIKNVGLLGVATFALLAAGCSTVSQESGLRARLEVTMLASHRTAHFDLHYRPRSAAERHVRRIAAAAERELARACRQLEVANDTRYSLYLFDRVAEIGATLGDPQVAGFALGRTVCVAYDDDGARLHETIHALATAKVGESRTVFLAEGLACALFDTPESDMHALAKYYRNQRLLPPAAGFATFATEAEWRRGLEQSSSINLFAVAGSWTGFLLESFGAERTKRYYLSGDALAAFGVHVPVLEQRWHTLLDRYAASPAKQAELAFTQGRVESRLTRIAGETVELSFAGEAGRPGSDYRWYKDAAILSGETAPTLQRSGLRPADTGVYTRAESNAAVGAASMVFLRSIFIKIVEPES